jgi:hypothetical protein
VTPCQETDTPDFTLLLSERTERRCERAGAECNNQFATSVHSILLVGGHYARLRHGQQTGEFLAADRCWVSINAQIGSRW